MAAKTKASKKVVAAPGSTPGQELKPYVLCLASRRKFRAKVAGSVYLDREVFFYDTEEECLEQARQVAIDHPGEHVLMALTVSVFTRSSEVIAS